MSEFGFLIDVSIIIISYIFIYKFRNQISKIFEIIPLPKPILAILSALPFIFIEESINCIDWGDGNGCRMTTWINFILIIEISILLYFTNKSNIQTIKKPLIYFSIFGLLWELIFGGLKGYLFSPFILFMAPYIALSYAYLATIPLTIYLNFLNSKK